MHKDKDLQKKFIHIASVAAMQPASFEIHSFSATVSISVFQQN